MTKSRPAVNADYLAKRKADGWREVRAWLDPATIHSLNLLTLNGESAQEVVRCAIRSAVNLSTWVEHMLGAGVDAREVVTALMAAAEKLQTEIDDGE